MVFGMWSMADFRVQNVARRRWRGGASEWRSDRAGKEREFESESRKRWI
jgi:hypothetical protein